MLSGIFSDGASDDMIAAMVSISGSLGTTVAMHGILHLGDKSNIRV